MSDGEKGLAYTLALWQKRQQFVTLQLQQLQETQQLQATQQLHLEQLVAQLQAQAQAQSLVRVQSLPLPQRVKPDTVICQTVMIRMGRMRRHCQVVLRTLVVDRSAVVVQEMPYQHLTIS